MRTTKLICALMLAGLCASPHAAAQPEEQAYHVEIFLFRVLVDYEHLRPAPPKPRDVYGEDEGAGGNVFAMEGDALTINEVPMTDKENVLLLTSPSIVTRPAEYSKVMVGEGPVQYLERTPRPTGCGDEAPTFVLKKSDQMSGVSAKVKVTPKGAKLHLLFDFEVTRVSARASLPGVYLDVGKPIFSVQSGKMDTLTELGHWVSLEVDLGGQGSVIGLARILEWDASSSQPPLPSSPSTGAND